MDVAYWNGKQSNSEGGLETEAAGLLSVALADSPRLQGKVSGRQISAVHKEEL